MDLEQCIRHRFDRALAAYRLIEDGDHILVGVSGGKDSLCLLEQLARRSRIFHPSFRVTALHVRMENVSYETDTQYLQEFCDGLGVELRIVTGRFDQPRGHGRPKPPCFLCSWARRKQLFNLAQEMGCNKIALGHHQDDLIHTALMNLIYTGHFSTMPVRLQLRKMPLAIIRPLCLQAEADLKAYAALHRYPQQLKRCPYEHQTNRTAVRGFFTEMESLNADARRSIWNALECSGKLIEEGKRLMRLCRPE